LLEHGYLKGHDIDFHVLFDKEGSGFDSFRVVSNDQGYYWHSFTDAQSREAYRKGWKLTFEAAVEEGHIWALIDNPKAATRVMAVLARNTEQNDRVLCLHQASPVRKGIERVLPGPAGARHTFVLTWTPASQGELSVDGVKLITGYAGEPAFRQSHGLEFGAARNRSQRGVGVFWKIRVDIA